MTSSHPDSRYVTPSSDDLAETVRTLALEPERHSASAARRFVVSALDEWGRPELCEDAAVCTAELVTNAILHSRDRFTVAVRRTARGARIDVLDARPDQLPLTVPDGLDPLDLGTTGRGLMMVAALADRWGYFTTDVAKTVWVELAPSAAVAHPSGPEVELAELSPAAAAVEIALLDIPVRLAIASGVQVDELVREAQLNHTPMRAVDQTTFADLLERSVRLRLIGRQAAFQAAADGRSHYSISSTATAAEVSALAELAPFLERLTSTSRLAVTTVSDEVMAMRAWINSEVATQLAGGTATPFTGA
jgi:anti-sigma regulatory factor (Ser/Thr protein kinase)